MSSQGPSGHGPWCHRQPAVEQSTQGRSQPASRHTPKRPFSGTCEPTASPDDQCCRVSGSLPHKGAVVESKTRYANSFTRSFTEEPRQGIAPDEQCPAPAERRHEHPVDGYQGRHDLRAQYRQPKDPRRTHGPERPARARDEDRQMPRHRKLQIHHSVWMWASNWTKQPSPWWNRCGEPARSSGSIRPTSPTKGALSPWYRPPTTKVLSPIAARLDHGQVPRSGAGLL